MIGSKWENFLKNLGEWQGSFTKISPNGELLGSTPSIISLEGAENNQLVKFRVRRFGPGGYDETPTQDYSQEYRHLGKQAIFFDTGAFSKGSLQLAPFAEFGAEFGFINEDRRLRCVQLYDRQGDLSNITLIREFRSGTSVQERPPLTLDKLLGKWQGIACTAYPDLSSSESYSTCLDVQKIDDNYIQQTLSFGTKTITSKAKIEGHKLIFNEGINSREILFLPDGASSNAPLKYQLREPFLVEVGWLLNETERQRLIRSYDASGAWVTSTHVIEHKVG
ncbi:DUF3598 family protein [Crocosphaera sp. XPORK-15E]|uniref:DUF3598 family protein n=1 Tax=Crocosphaera sp. XPORK-15E TaxID=3110247 RepID=UPI002B212219|nr:DUF3598 family protein [Crocosphaera sp. XPORK-15E]MEA5533360.1 DUF3598 family protein [Crocosphaera sp. XPORK-15E]